MTTTTTPTLSNRLGLWFLRQLHLNNGLQVVGAIGGLWGNYLINHTQVAGFLLWMMSNGALVWLQVRMRMWALVMLHFAYLYLCFEGMSNWYVRSPESFPTWIPHWVISLAQMVA